VTHWKRSEPRGDGLDAAAAARTAVREIEHNDEEHLEALTAAFLCAAWPTARAQNQ
jgi:hypothetical protein